MAPGKDRTRQDRPRRNSSRRRPLAPNPAQTPAAGTSWDALAGWYDGWVGEGGSEHHQKVAIPAVMRLLQPQPGERVLDVGAGQGVLAPYVARTGARYVGVDASPRLSAMARKRHGKEGRFLVGDARDLESLPDIDPESFDASVFLLSLQDMDPLEPILASAARILKPGGRLVLLLTHPSFRIPRQSGWGFDEGRKLVYRRVDRYLTPLPVPMKPFPGQEGRTWSFHRPLQVYVNALSDAGMVVDRMEEVPAGAVLSGSGNRRADAHARQEIPLFLVLRAVKLPSG
jgi:ubiquinone/menaquinone biosynthesis C-methylase UbiE